MCVYRKRYSGIRVMGVRLEWDVAVIGPRFGRLSTSEMCSASPMSLLPAGLDGARRRAV